MSITGTTPLLCLRNEQGAMVAGVGDRWIGPTSAEDERLLDLVVTPVLDVGCGPARHLLALAHRGIHGLGLDVTPSAVRLARSRGARVIEGSIFGPVPGSGTWATALLLDGNIGIGGDPVALLVRVTALLRPGGTILAELEAPGAGGRTERARVHHDVHTGPWFDWAVVDAASIRAITSDADLDVVAPWSAGGRWFVQLGVIDHHSTPWGESSQPTDPAGA